MSYVLQRHRYYADIVERETERVLARVYITARPPYAVCDAQGRFLFGTSDLSKVVPEFERCYDEPPWEWLYAPRMRAGGPNLYVKRSPFGEFRVQETTHGAWMGLRDGGPLCDGPDILTFGTRGAAQAAVDRYSRLPSGTVTEDCIWWAPHTEEGCQGDEEPVNLMVDRLLPTPN
jgi:hypothetical protein